jgi:hypothetical protein
VFCSAAREIFLSLRVYLLVENRAIVSHICWYHVALSSHGNALAVVAVEAYGVVGRRS